MIKWKDEYLIGIDEIDRQHKELVCIANEAYGIFRNELVVDKYQRIYEIVNRLNEYIIDHFATEEKYMISMGYRKFLSHKIAHEEFIKKISNLDLKKADENQNEYLLNIARISIDWFVEHIMVLDKEISKL